MRRSKTSYWLSLTVLYSDTSPGYVKNPFSNCFNLIGNKTNRALPRFLKFQCIIYKLDLSSHKEAVRLWQKKNADFLYN